jgi:hypothetical protein
LAVSRTTVTVTVTRRRGREPIDTETPVQNLEELFEICRGAAPSEGIRVSLKRDDGEVRLNFASFIRSE